MNHSAAGADTPSQSDYAGWERVNRFLSSFAEQTRCDGPFGHLGPAVYRDGSGVVCMECSRPIRNGDQMRGVPIQLTQ